MTFWMIVRREADARTRRAARGRAGATSFSPWGSAGGGPMLLGLIGRVMKVLARFRSGEARRDLEHVGDELVRLDRRPPQARATSR